MTNPPKPEEKQVVKKTKKRFTQDLSEGRVFIQATYNNTLITITDRSGNAVLQGSSGAQGFKGTRKGTPYAAQVVATNLARKVLDLGM
ncbi:MAG TPA: 30S ribosomal protein S11, partial [bacterium]|nr:30S ribosomal protein S11 [bacterium]